MQSQIFTQGFMHTTILERVDGGDSGRMLNEKFFISIQSSVDYI